MAACGGVSADFDGANGIDASRTVGKMKIGDNQVGSRRHIAQHRFHCGGAFCPFDDKAFSGQQQRPGARDLRVVLDQQHPAADVLIANRRRLGQRFLFNIVDVARRRTMARPRPNPSTSELWDLTW